MPTEEAFSPTISAQLGPLATGEVLAGRYEVLAPLGEGGMGVVYRARDQELDEEVALKVLHPALACEPEQVQRFRREVKLARRVTHPAVARTYDLGVDGPRRFITMELLRGETLAMHAKGGVSLSEALRIAATVARGLAAAHAEGVVHRDLKPENVMLCESLASLPSSLAPPATLRTVPPANEAERRIVITDFGIARAHARRDGERNEHTTAKLVLGTPAYMAPEQVEGALVDGRADVYALGVVLFELLTGKLPFEGETPLAIASARLVRSPPDPRSIVARIPDGIAELVLAALERHRAKRPDAQTMVGRLEELRGIAPASALPLEVVPRESRSPESLSFGDLESLVDERSIRVSGIEAGNDPQEVALARDLQRAIEDAILADKSIRLTADRGPLLDGTVRVSGGRARVRLRLSDREGAPIEAVRVEEDASEVFALEDKVAESALALSKRAVRPRRRMPEGPLAERFAKARALYERFDLGSVIEAIEILEVLHQEDPSEPLVSATLACALLRRRGQEGGTDGSLLARAEDLVLRTVDAEASPEVLYAVGALRIAEGDFAGAMRAASSALRLAPRFAEAHHMVGTILCDVGRVSEGLPRLELACRLAPREVIAQLRLATMLGLLGEREKAESTLRRVREEAGPFSTVVAELDLVVWFADGAGASALADRLEHAPPTAAWRMAAPMLRALGGEQREADAIRSIFSRLTGDRVSPGRRANMCRVAADFYARIGDGDEALRFLARAATVRAMIDLNWMDRSPALVAIRDDPRFAEARARVAARVAAMGL